MTRRSLFCCVDNVSGSYPSPMYETLDDCRRNWAGPYVEFVWYEAKLIATLIHDVPPIEAPSASASGGHAQSERA